MQKRSLAVRLVLVVAALTTVATSAPDDIVMLDTTEGTLAPGATRISLFANRAAVNHADFVHLELSGTDVSGSGGTSMPDPTLPVQLSGIPRSGVTLEYNIESLCERDRDCDTGITIEIPEDAPIGVTVTARFVRAGDGALLFPDNPPFPRSAVLEVRIEP